MLDVGKMSEPPCKVRKMIVRDRSFKKVNL